MHHWSLSLWCLCAAVWSLQPSLTEAIPCTSTGGIQQYRLTPPPTSGQTSGCIGASGSLSCPTISLLTDGNVALSDGNPFTWDQSSSVLAGFNRMPAAVVYRANIYFRNEPSQGIGLPSVEAGFSYGSIFFQEVHLETTILGNQDLSQTDSGLRNISLVVTTDLSDWAEFSNFFITFSFHDSIPVNSLVICEVELCTDEVNITLDPITFDKGDITVEIGPDDVISTVDLSCTVTNEGRFDFTWTLPPAATDYQTVSLDGTRTSRLQVSRLTSSHSGEYVCQANYNAAAVPFGQTAPQSSSRTITLNLMGALQPDEPRVTGMENESVSLSCEMYGYFTGVIEIIWRLGNEGQIESDSIYSITEVNGDRLLQNGGDSPVPSVRSILTIETPTRSQAGTYVCVGGGLTGIVILDIEPEPTDPFPSPTPPPVDDGGDSSSGGSGGVPIAAVAGGVIGGLVVLILVVVIIIVVMWLLRRRKSAKAEIHEYDYIGPPQLPPSRTNNMAMKTSPAYSAGSAHAGFTMEKNEAYGHITMQQLYRE